VSEWMSFAVAVLATWRVTHLLANEDGPADVIFRLRRRLGEGFIGSLMDCFNCMSIWVAAAIGVVCLGEPCSLVCELAGAVGRGVPAGTAWGRLRRSAREATHRGK
jgi:hypothetical protein